MNFPARGAPVLFFEQLDSSNRALRDLAREGAADGTVLIAGRQTAGRGRMGRSFLSPEGGLYLSILHRPEGPPEAALPVTACAAAALCRCLEALTGLRPGIKWPNDLLLGGKKIAGILAEGSFDAQGRFFVVLGLGVNLRTAAFPPELADTAGSLLLETGRSPAPAELAEALIPELDAMLAGYRRQAALWLARYRARCLTPGRRVLLPGPPPREGRALAVTEDYALLVDFGGKAEALRVGEVSLGTL